MSFPRVALDARTMQDAPLGGIGRGLANLVPLLAKEVELHLLVDGRRAPIEVDLPQHKLVVPVVTRGAAWLQLAVPRWLRSFDGIFHCPFYGLPFRQPTPMVVTIHDLTFEDHPEWFSRLSRLTFRVQARHGARTAARVVTDSEHVRQRVIDRYRVPHERVVVVPFAVDRGFRHRPEPATVARVLNRLGIESPYVVTLGGAPRRQLDVAVAAWRNVRHANGALALVVVGAEAPPHEPGVTWAGAVPDEDWAALLAAAEAFCYPTAEEGFGMPAVEAAAIGTPVVCARVGSLPEVLGEAAEWCDRPDPAAMAAGLRRVLDNRGRADELRQAGLRRTATRPSWEDAATVLLRVYHAARHG